MDALLPPLIFFYAQVLSPGPLHFNGFFFLISFSPLFALIIFDRFGL